MKPLDDVLKNRADEFELERGDALVAIQEILNTRYNHRVRAKKLKDGVLTLATPSSVVVHQLRMDSPKLIDRFSEHGVESIRTSQA